MIKTLLQKLFHSDKKWNKNLNGSIETTEFELEKGQVQLITTPELKNQKGLTLAKWYFKSGDIIKSGDIVCIIENENISMEFESFFSGRLLSPCKLNEKLTAGAELFKVEGI